MFRSEKVYKSEQCRKEFVDALNDLRKSVRCIKFSMERIRRAVDVVQNSYSSVPLDEYMQWDWLFEKATKLLTEPLKELEELIKK